MMEGDILLREDEMVDGSRPVTACHTMYPQIRKIYKPHFETEELLVPVFIHGDLVYERPTLKEIQANTFRNLERIEPEYKRLTNPHVYKVSLSEKLNRVKERLLALHGQT
jgi:nicotinate phosphoribosyltransferase